MSIENVTIRTERLVLRPLTTADAEALAFIGTDDIFSMVPDIETPFDAGAWVEHKLESEEPPICHMVLLKDETTIIGFVQINFGVGRHDYYLNAGYWFGQNYWGQGYATETLSAVLEHLSQPQLRPLYAMVDRRNGPSIRVLEIADFF